MDFPPMSFDSMNEADVRGEIIDPLLRSLGYRSGTEFNIVRERWLRYPRKQLGRRKTADPYVIGKPDYIVEIRGTNRWIVEAKSPTATISSDDVYQAYSYASHSEVLAGFFVLSNGRRIQVFKTVSGPDAPPLLDIDYSDLNEKFQVVSNVLSAVSFERALANDYVDIGRPLLDGWASSATITSGHIQYTDATSENSVANQKIRRIIGVRLPISSGKIWRRENRIAVSVKMGFIHQHQEQVHRSMNALEFTYYCKDRGLSTDPSSPNIFESTSSYTFHRGYPAYDLFTQEQSIMPLDGRMTTFAEALGSIQDDSFRGKFFGAAEIWFDSPTAPTILAECSGDLQLNLAE